MSPAQRELSAYSFSNASTDWADWLDSYEGVPSAAAEKPAPKTAGEHVHSWLDRSAVTIPGLVLAAFLSFVAYYVADWSGRLLLGFEKSPIGSVPAAVCLGVLLRNAVGVPKQYEAGLKVCVRSLLRLGIVLLGLRISLPSAAAIGLAGLPVIASCIVAALAAALLFGRVFRLSEKQSLLIATGTSICGVSAIAAAAPVMDAKDDEVSYSIACVTLFGMLAMFGYPIAAHLLFGGDPRLAGYLLGTSIHDTAQVAGAAMMYRLQFNAPEALDIATVTKLVRNTSMILVIPLIGLYVRRKGQAGASGGVRLSQAVPFFVIAYLGMAALRSAGDVGYIPFRSLDGLTWHGFLTGADLASTWLLASAMAAVGLGTDISRIRKLGWRPMAVGLGTALLAGVVSLVLLKTIPPGV